MHLGFMNNFRGYHTYSENLRYAKPRHWECVSCGYRVCAQRHHASWLARYRVLYSTPSGAQLSDVSVAELDWFWEEWENYRNDGDDDGKLGPWFTMVRIKPACAFLIHPSCWSLLQTHFAVKEINLDRLLELCRNIPPSGRGEYYYHTDESAYKVVRHNKKSQFYPSLRPVVLGLREAAKVFPKVGGATRVYGSNVAFVADCFSSLAIEIRLEIAVWLPTKDFLSLRSSSRAMAAVFGIQSFWKSRFRVDGDRGFLNCLVENPRKYESKNWRLIYQATARIDRSKRHLWEMRRQWRHNRWLRERYSMTRASDEKIASDKKLPHKLHWEESYAELRCDRDWGQGTDYDSCKHCLAEHIPFVQTVTLESSVISLAVSVLREGAYTFITGFELISADTGSNVIFGYRLPGGQVIIDNRNKQLRGFTVLTGEGGIHAIRPIWNNDDTIASWIGQPEGDSICKSSDICLQQDIKGFSGKFDHCKMLGLSIAYDVGSRLPFGFRLASVWF